MRAIWECAAPKGMVLCLFGLESGLVFGELRKCRNVFVISVPIE